LLKVENVIENASIGDIAISANITKYS